MIVDFYEGQGGQIILVTDHGNYRAQRDIVMGVSFDELMKIRRRFNLTDIKTAELAKRLASISLYQSILLKSETGSDGALANWIDDECALGSIAAVAKVADKERFAEVCAYAGNVLDKINTARLKRGKTTKDALRYLGYDIQEVGSEPYLGGTAFIENWFLSAVTVLKALEITKGRIRKRDRKTFRLTADDSAQRRLFGMDLPRLYERITGNAFQSTAKGRLKEVEQTDCHIFVAMASIAIDKGNPSARTIHDHWATCRKT